MAGHRVYVLTALHHATTCGVLVQSQLHADLQVIPRDVRLGEVVRSIATPEGVAPSEVAMTVIAAIRAIVLDKEGTFWACSGPYWLFRGSIPVLLGSDLALS